MYNTRFLAFATHYGFRPRACWPRRPQTKGKVERPFWYVELNLLNGRTFSGLEHLNQTTQVWLANTADVRIHRETSKRPIDAHAEEQAHLFKLPATPYDTARVVYRVVDGEGMITYENNSYSVPWRFVGRMLPVRITEQELIVYDLASLEVVACHLLVPRSAKGERQIDAAHRPTRDSKEQEEVLRDRFRELGEPAPRFLEGLLRTLRDGKGRAARRWAFSASTAARTCWRLSSARCVITRSHATRCNGFWPSRPVPGRRWSAGTISIAPA